MGPIKIEVQNKSPYIAVLKEILFSNECDNITSFLSPFLGTPPGRMRGGTGKNDWTMKKYEIKFVKLRVELIPVLLNTNPKIKIIYWVYLINVTNVNCQF